MEKIIKTIKLNDGYQLKMVLNPLFIDEEDINIDRLLFIDYANLAAEIATFSVVFAHISFIRSDLNREVRKAEMELKVYKSKTKKAYREEMLEEKMKFTVDMPDDFLRSQPNYKIYNLRHIEALHRYETIDSLYWSVKNKSDQLRGLSLPHNEFVEQMMNTSVREINYVNLSLIKPLIP